MIGYLVTWFDSVVGLSVHAYAEAEGRPDNQVPEIYTTASLCYTFT
jgi:hypothetical protein